MEAAGLNPGLAYQQGGASSPSGSSASGSAAHFDSSAGAGLNSASSVSNVMQSAASRSATRQETLARADLTAAQAQRTRLLADAELGELLQRTRGHSASSSQKEVQTLIDRELYPLRSKLLHSQDESMQASAAGARQSARESEARTSLYGPQRKLLELQVPTAENMSNAADSWFMKNIAPYLNSAGQVGRLINPFYQR